MTDYRALCAELVDIATAHCTPDDSAVGHCIAVLTRAHAALAQPETVAPTDEELITMWATTSYIDQPEGGLAFARAVLAQSKPAPTDEELEELADVMNVSGNPVPAMRRALELWGYQ